MHKNYFEESQKFHAWIWFLIIPSLLLFVGVAFAGVYIQLILKRPFGNNPMSDTGIMIFAVMSILFSIGFILLFKSFHLQTKIDRFGISYRFFPLIRKWHTIYREEIMDCEVVTRITMSYGMKYGLNSKTFTLNGDKQLAIKRSAGKKLYIGTQRPDELSHALQKFFNRQPIE